MNLFAIKHYPQYARQLLWNLRSRWLFRFKGVERTGKVYCYGIPIIERHVDSNIIFGDKVSLCSDSRHTALGVSGPVILRTLRPHASIFIGRESGLSGTTICSSTTVRIGERCLIGADVMISDTDFHPLIPEGRRYRNEKDALAAPVDIGDDVFIGARAVILKGVSIGKGSVVGAGSVVTKDIPERVVCAGNPARVLRVLPDFLYAGRT